MNTVRESGKFSRSSSLLYERNQLAVRFNSYLIFVLVSRWNTLCDQSAFVCYGPRWSQGPRAEFLVSLHLVASQSFFRKWSTILQLAGKPLYSYIQYHWGQQCVFKGRLVILIEGKAIFNLIAPRESMSSIHVPRIWSMCATSLRLRHGVKKDMVWLKLTLGRQYVISAKTRFEDKMNHMRC